MDDNTEKGMCPRDMINASVVVGTMWICSGTAVQLLLREKITNTKHVP
jgi:hypothetical protein